MHRSSFNPKPTSGVKGEEEILLSITTLVTEGRVPEKLGPKSKGYREGPHCFLNNQTNEHICSPTDSLCVNYEYIREELLKLLAQDDSPTLCIEVLLLCPCQDGEHLFGSEIVENCILLESWNFSIRNKSPRAPPSFQVPQLVNAIRSQLYFSQITAWLTTQQENSKNRLTNKHLRYRIALPVETFKSTVFTANSVEHTFPSTDIGSNRVLNVSFLSLPRGSAFPIIECMTCNSVEELVNISFSRSCPVDIPFSRSCPVGNIQEEKLAGEKKKSMFDDRMHTMCRLKGKHHCEDFEEIENNEKCEKLAKIKRFRQNLREEQPSTSTLNHINSTRQCRTNPSRIELIDSMMPNGSVHCKENEDTNDSTDKTCHFYNDLIYKEEDKSKILLEAIERVGLRSPEKSRKKSSDSLPNDIHKIKDVEMEFQDYNDMNGTTIMNMQSKYSSMKMDQCCSNNCSIQTKISSNKNKKASLPSCDRHRSAVSSIKLDEELECANEKCVCDNVHCDTRKSDICRYRNRCSIHVDKKYCDSPIPTIRYLKMKELSNNSDNKGDKKHSATRKLTFENFKNATEEQSSSSDLFDKQNCPNGVIPTAVEQAEFRKNLDNAASMVFHSRTGLPLTSSPAPVRKGKTCFDFDSSINSVSDIKSALFPSNFSADDDSESDGSLVSPCSPETNVTQCEKLEAEKEIKPPVRCHRSRKGHASNLLGSFEESVLHGRLQPVSTVHGFTAELGASGSFVPKHLVVPVTVFFYTLCDNDRVSTPYLCHINLGKKGYSIPKRGTVQVTLFNPLGTVVKMFVIMYDLSDMPPNSQTFIRQRTLYMPNKCEDMNSEWGPKWLKYLIHLRFVSSKSGKIYLHSDIRMIIFHQADLDTAAAHTMDLCYELRSFILTPTNPRFSPRK